ncbi:hypothetical protein Z043_106263 [Scleropages formosus]|uniref:Uncharacterized protein n=1 Tax=Scleropages formosus TaxID=113540 RepID=A0A0P7UWW2_SCLFO|nr:hypothetical protein Z043_106263 [Scleropages formosus]
MTAATPCSPADACVISPVQVVQNPAARSVLGSRKHSHFTPIPRCRHYLLVSYRYHFWLHCITCKAPWGLALSYLAHLLSSYLPNDADVFVVSERRSIRLQGAETMEGHQNGVVEVLASILSEGDDLIVRNKDRHPAPKPATFRRMQKRQRMLQKGSWCALETLFISWGPSRVRMEEGNVIAKSRSATLSLASFLAGSGGAQVYTLSLFAKYTSTSADDLRFMNITVYNNGVVMVSLGGPGSWPTEEFTYTDCIGTLRSELADGPSPLQRGACVVSGPAKT